MVPQQPKFKSHRFAFTKNRLKENTIAQKGPGSSLRKGRLTYKGMLEYKNITLNAHHYFKVLV